MSLLDTFFKPFKKIFKRKRKKARKTKKKISPLKPKRKNRKKLFTFPKRKKHSAKTKRSKPKRKLIRKRKKPLVKIKRSSLKKKSKVRVASAPKLKKESSLGEITHYFSRIQVVVIKITKGELNTGDQIHIKGKVTDFVQRIESMQIESVDVKNARKGQVIGLKVEKIAKEGDKVFKV